MQLKSNINTAKGSVELLSTSPLGVNEQSNLLGNKSDISSNEFASMLDNTKALGEALNQTAQYHQLNPAINPEYNTNVNAKLNLPNELQAGKDLQGQLSQSQNPMGEVLATGSLGASQSIETQGNQGILGQNEVSLKSSELNNTILFGEGSGEVSGKVPVALNGDQGQISTAKNNLLGNTTQSDLKSILEGSQNLEMKHKNAEDASRQFVPQRKSIFDVAKGNEAARLNTEKNVPSGQNLVSLDNFVNRQAPSVQQRLAHQAYQNKVETSLLNKKLESKLESIGRPTPKNNIMEMMLDQDVKAMDRHIHIQGSGAHSNELSNSLATQTPKVFDMSSLKGTDNRDAIIDQVQNYIVQAKAASEPKVEMSFKHHELGLIDLQVHKATGDQITISIAASTPEGMKFFTQNQNELLGSLSNAGIKVSDLKLETSNGQSDFSQDPGQKHRQETAGDQRQQESRKREELWNLFRERREAA